ncbi:NACHT domain-containing protein [Streptomyces sp. NBC_01294]|uniref:NACHT domain-containing protein n=1 Tax=Streptomyces sp. NBC_01294 TaxID=2903815 RepID=UPI002DDA113E|nr:NACHT domain-containing protein [Streptomyces sp. NBC_01294]WRZ60273.1 NACHT domain-containing protein [Streptomyces sp. NBC_01294]
MSGLIDLRELLSPPRAARPEAPRRPARRVPVPEWLQKVFIYQEDGRHGGIDVRYMRLGIWVSALIVTAAVVIVTALSGKGLTEPEILIALLGFFVAAGELVRTLLHDVAEAEHQASSPEQLDRLAGRLADAVKDEWQEEWRLRRLQDPDPLPVPWALAEPWLSDACGDWDDMVDAGDRWENVAEVFNRVPSRRMVVLGAPGSGKTVLAVRFTLDELRRRQPGDPVPVILSLSSWRPDRESLRTWAATSLATKGIARVQELLANDRVLLVLDGLDEIPPPLRIRAVSRLNAELDTTTPVLLTCRTQDYAEQVESGDAFTSAAVVELRPPSFDDVSTYLVRTARPVRGASGERTTRWDPVLAHLRDDPDAAVCHTVRQVFQTPLMVAMTRVVYSDGKANPAELLDPRFTDRADLEQHLLEGFVPAAFSDSPDAGRVGRWLGFLAAHLERRQARDLAWWRLRLALPWPLRHLGPILLLGTVAITIILVVAPTEGLAAPLVATALLVGVCIGYVVLSHSPGLTLVQRGRALQGFFAVAGTAAVLGVIAGTKGSLIGQVYEGGPFYFEPKGPPYPVFWLAMTGGLATAVVLAVIGIVGEPVPSTASFSGRRQSRTALILTVVAVLTTVGSYLRWHSFETLMLGVCVSVMTLLYALAAVRGAKVNPGVRSTEAARPRPVGRTRRWQQLGQAVGRALAAGLIAGFCLGAPLGLAAGTAQAIRAGIHQAFPEGSDMSTLRPGIRCAGTPNGWSQCRSPRGERFVRASHDVEVVRLDGVSAWAGTPGTTDACARRGRCTTFRGLIELHVERDRRFGHLFLVAVFPDGTDVTNRGFDRRLPHQTTQWLYSLGPAELFSNAVTFSLAGGLTIGLISGIVAALHRWLFSPVDVVRALSPRASLHTDRTTAIAQGLIVFLFGVLAIILLFLALPQLATEARASLSTLIWPLVGTLAIALSAWGWFLTARLWLCGTGRLPWRLMTFLNEAHRRGVLRQEGAVYQFRHARVQTQLATAYEQQVSETT